MKRLYLLLLVTLVCHHVKAQFFEGYVEYVHSITMPDSSMDIKKAWPLFGTSSVYFYKNGAYRWSFNNCEVTDEYYIPANNNVKVYYKLQPPESAPATDPCRIIRDSMLAETAVVMGVPCKKYYIEVRISSGIMKRTFYFNDTYSLDPASFSRFSTNAMNHVYARIKAIPLRIDVITSDGYKTVYTAHKVVQQHVDDKLMLHP